MTFTRKRGRPRKATPQGTDLGTPELVHKRAASLTDEALDLCLARGIITPDQHWCGIHLRWLYTLRYGAPGVRAVDPLHFGGRELVKDNPDWRREREREYHEALAALGSSRHVMRTLSLCVYNQRPACFSVLNPTLYNAKRRLRSHEKELDEIRLCLDRLAGLWCRRKGRK